MRQANFEVTTFSLNEPLILRDLGPWDHFTTITNDAENVVLRLFYAGYLPTGRRLFYYDSDGNYDEILVKDGKFAGFAPGRKSCPTCKRLY